MTVGAPLTVKPLASEAVVVSGFVTVTVREPVAAPTSIVTFALSSVALTKVVELTVTPAPKDAVAPVSKLVPLTATFSVPPWSPELGLVEVTVGPALTVKALASDPLPASGLVTVTARAPVAAPEAIVTLALSSVALSNVVELTVMPAPNEAVAPLTKFVPLTATVSVPPRSPELGLVEVTVGAALTVKALASEPLPASGFVTVTVRALVLAPLSMVMLAFSSLALTKVVELTVMPAPKEALAPLTKPPPVIVTF